MELNIKNSKAESIKIDSDMFLYKFDIKSESKVEIENQEFLDKDNFQNGRQISEEHDETSLSSKNENSDSEKQIKSLNHCDICDKTFAAKSNLRKHVKIAHSITKNFTCDLCNKTFGQSSGLKIHKQAVHGNTKAYKCEYCDESFALKIRLKRHSEAIHENIKVHKCNSCDKSFASKNYLDKHFNLVHMKTYTTHQMNN